MKHTALITGASRGIGAALACRFAAEGYHLALCCHNSYETLQALATKLETTCSIQVLCFRGDVGDYTFICDMVQKTLDTFGQIDVLINNAGISYIGLLTDMDITDWNQIVATNLTSVFSTCRQVIPSMVHAKSGHIINISSVWGNVGASCEVAYSACKGGINSLTKDKEITDPSICDVHINLPDVSDEFTIFESVVIFQLIAYYTSVGKGLNPDQPRNLAKSVTVE